MSTVKDPATPTVSINTRHTQKKKGSANVFMETSMTDEQRSLAVEVVCSSARRRMDHQASHNVYRLFSHTLNLNSSPNDAKKSTWPEHTDICCWHCCHQFDTVPISVPRIMSSSGGKTNQYEVYGVFCSVNCTKKFVLERKGFDQSQVLLQLNEMCCSVFGMDSNEVFTAKAAPPRFFLKMFGGHMDIEEFRAKSLTTHTILVMPPFVSHAMILESHSINKNGAESASTTLEEETKREELIEPLREGQHMLRGLRRPTVPMSSPPPQTSENEVSRFEAFVKERARKGDTALSGSHSNTPDDGNSKKPLRAAKKPRKKEPVGGGATTGNANTLNSFLMMQPPSSSSSMEID
jgi:hypothetical protein